MAPTRVTMAGADEGGWDFTSQAASHIDGLVTPIAEDYLSRFEKTGTAELMSEYFEPISILSLARSLGFGDVELETLHGSFFGLGEGAPTSRRIRRKRPPATRSPARSKRWSNRCWPGCV